jgi:hypothetical protein
MRLFSNQYSSLSKEMFSHILSLLLRLRLRLTFKLLDILVDKHVHAHSVCHYMKNIIKRICDDLKRRNENKRFKKCIWAKVNILLQQAKPDFFKITGKIP